MKGGGMNREGWWTLEFDGACDRNGSADARGGYGWRVLDDAGQEIADGHGAIRSGPLGSWVSCNVAEWRGLIAGLEWLLSYKECPAGLLVRGDSELVVRVFSAEWKSKKPHLTVLRDHARSVAATLRYPIDAAWMPRERNDACDRLSKCGLRQNTDLGH